MRVAVVSFLRSIFASRATLHAEIAVLRHQLAIYERTVKRPKLKDRDRLLWTLFSRLSSRWRDMLYIVKPRTVIEWRRRGFKRYWARLCCPPRPGRPPIPKELKDLIRRLSTLNVLWGAEHIVGELAKFGIAVSKSTVAKYMVRRSGPPSPTWTAFLRSHLRDMISVDFFVVPTIRNRILYVFLVLSHERRRVLHFNVTTNPTAEWTGQQLIEAFAWTDAPRFLLRDRDGIYGKEFRRKVRVLGMRELLSGPRKPWQSPYVERLIGTIRRECLDHVIVLNERHLTRVLGEFLRYYHCYRVHRGLGMDTPDGRAVEAGGSIHTVPHLGGLHHHVERCAA